MKRYACAMIALTATAGVAIADSVPNATDDSTAELRALITQLQSEVDTLKAQNDQSWLTEQRANEIRGLVQDVLADADTRASLLQAGAVAGYDKGFFLASADGNYRLKIGGRLQVRFVYNNNDSADDEHRWGFENRRTRLDFSGHILNPSWFYQIQGDFGRGGDSAVTAVNFDGDTVTTSSINRGSFQLLDAVIGYKFENGMTLRVGQFKSPFMRENLVSSGRQLAVERSLVHARFTTDRTQGIELAMPLGDNFRFAVMYSDGARQTNTPWETYDTEYAFTGRTEFLAAGNWSQFADFSSWNGDEGMALLLGAAAHVQRDEYGTAAGPEVQDLRWTIDATAKFGGGLSLFGAVVARHTDDAPTDVDQYGIVIQGGFFIVPNEWELFARYEWGDADLVGVEDLSVVTLGFNRYWAKHNLKWTSDFGYGLNEVASFWASSSSGWRADPTDEDGQFVIRSQLQLAF